MQRSEATTARITATVGLVATIATFALAGCSPAGPQPARTPPTQTLSPSIAEHTREDCIEMLVLGQASGCLADIDDDSWFIAAGSAHQCAVAPDLVPISTVCVVTEGFEKGATFPVPQAP